MNVNVNLSIFAQKMMGMTIEIINRFALSEKNLFIISLYP